MHLGLLKGYLLKKDQAGSLKQIEWFARTEERGRPQLPMIEEAVKQNRLNEALQFYRFYFLNQ